MRLEFTQDQIDLLTRWASEHLLDNQHDLDPFQDKNRKVLSNQWQLYQQLLSHSTIHGTRCEQNPYSSSYKQEHIQYR